MNKKTLVILISESLIGTHTELKNKEDIAFFEMRIPVNIKYDNKLKKWVNNSSLTSNQTFINILELFNSKKDEYDIFFLVGFDCDMQGEYMSFVLKEHLMKNGIDEKYIFRMPFVEGEYIALTNFKNLDDFFYIKGIENKFMSFLKGINNSSSFKLPIMSIGKILALKELSENKNVLFETNSGNSTFTYITSKLTNLEKEKKENQFQWIQEI